MITACPAAPATWMPAAALRVAATDRERDAAIATWLAASPATARRVVLAEGVLFDRSAAPGVPLVGLAAGCPCCTGLLALRVALGRALRRHRPDQVLLLVANAGHLPRLHGLLEQGELGVRFEVEMS